MGPTFMKRSPSHIVVLLGLHHVDRTKTGSSVVPRVAVTLKKLFIIFLKYACR